MRDDEPSALKVWVYRGFQDEISLEEYWETAEITL